MYCSEKKNSFESTQPFKMVQGQFVARPNVARLNVARLNVARPNVAVFNVAQLNVAAKCKSYDLLHLT
jgi:hypothetical protein